MYTVQARYRYEWAGRPHESTRVGLPGSAGSDNIDAWHHDWDARLRAARDGGPPVTAWVDPQHPERAVLDPKLRWRKLLFMLPFAVLFPLVALGAVYAAWKIVTPAGPAEPDAAGLMADELAQPATSRHIPRHNAVGLWLAAVALCVMSLAGIGMASSPSASGWMGLIVAVFALIGLLMLHTAARATGRAWAYRGAFASFQPAQPRAGAAFQAHWTLPPGAATRPSLRGSVRLRVAQYRIDDSGSSASEHLVEELVQEVRPRLDPDGGVTLLARFELPVDAPAHESRRSGEQVAWRFEWLDAKQDVILVVPIPVQSAAPVHDDAMDRLSPEARSANLSVPIGTTDDAMPSLPAGVSLYEQPHALLLGFSQSGWRWFGVITLTALLIAVSRSMVWLEAALLALTLHALSRRWTLEVGDDGVLLERVSWLWRRRIGLPAASLQGLYQRHLYSRTTGRQMTAFHALHARGVDRGSDLQLTPGLPGNGPTLIAQMLRWALAQRGGRFSPGALRPDHPSQSRAGWGWILPLLWVVVRLSPSG